MKKLWRGQLDALHTLFALYAPRFIEGWRDRDQLSAGARLRSYVRSERLAWASQNIGRELGSFSELSADEAGRLIELMKRALGQETKPAWRRPRDREAALAAGTHGRRNRPTSIEMLATHADLAEVDQLRERLCMTRERFETWLASRSSPTGRRGAHLRTVADCNRVRWALKAMLRRAS